MNKGRAALLRIERGEPDEVELAALTAVLLMIGCARGATEVLPEGVGSSGWEAPRGFVAPGSWC
ncbi:acyl-CoA carboxylase subunit epsilon [Streptomyces sp. NPDC051684]|uniref:acyl-CoA carboxylase subunit epsilon n=1 Tax=Streptomyces sp. NPDC051684 TaxID=3365670 RepID=UPI003789BE56